MPDLADFLRIGNLTPEARALAEFALGIRTVRSRPRPTGRRPQQPLAVEREYAALTVMIAETVADASRRVLLEHIRAEERRELLATDADMDPDELGVVLGTLRDLLERVGAMDVSEQVDRISDRMARWNAADQSRVLGVSLDAFGPGVESAMSTWRRQQAELITSIPRKHLGRVVELVEQAQSSGMRVETLAKKIEAEFGIARRRAQLIATDQILTANANLTRVRQQDLGIESYTWSTVGDERVRPVHAAADGQVYTWAEGHPTEGHPGEPVRCRCQALAVL